MANLNDAYVKAGARASMGKRPRSRPGGGIARTLARVAMAVGMWSAAWGAVGDARADGAQGPRYHYVSLDAAVPAGSDFFDPVKVDDRERVYGTLFGAGRAFVAVYRWGAITSLQEGIAYTANERGAVGGSVLVDPANFIEQAAVFEGGRAKLIPPLPGELSSHVVRLTELGIALVESLDATTFETTYYLYRRGRAIPLDFGPSPVDFLDVNDLGQIAGTLRPAGPSNDRAFRFYASAGTMTLLEPLATEPKSWGQAINGRGDVLGYSFIAGGLERIGVWRGQRFQTFFVEGTPQFPTISERLLWNEHGLIVITRTSRADLNSYLVPRPGVRLKLADLADTLPAWTLIGDVNEDGDLIGSGGSAYFQSEGTFLLQRVDGEPSAAPAQAPARSARAVAREHPVMVGERLLPRRMAAIAARRQPIRESRIGR